MLLCLPALSEDITASSRLSTARYASLPKLTDRDYTTVWTGSGAVSIAADKPIRGLYLTWAQRPESYLVEAQIDGQWRRVHEASGPDFAHEYIALDEGYTALRLKPGAIAKLSEIYLLGEGEIPDWVQRWQPTHDSCDLMVLIAHPDDEVVMFGGAIPYYAGELHKRVTVASMTVASPRRLSELLDSLWTCGLRHYPVLGDFADRYFKSRAAAYERWGTRAARSFVVELFRRYKPQVVVTHDERGEYGHGAHMVCADTARAAVTMAAQSDKYAALYERYGLWEVKKLYLHLSKQNPIEMDWDVPLASFGGKTAFQAAQAAYDKHRSQHQFGFRVYARGERYSSYRFGLVFSRVGPDVSGNDFLENLN